MGKVVFIGPKSSRLLVLKVYIQYYYIEVQRLSCTSKYYPEGIPKSSERDTFGVRLMYYLQSTTVLSVEHTSGVSTYFRIKRQKHMSANPSVRLVQKSNSSKCSSSIS
jgi:hypothetical protein